MAKREQTRRRVLQAGGGAALVGLSGCAGLLSDSPAADETASASPDEATSSVTDDESESYGDPDLGEGEDEDESDDLEEPEADDLEEPTGALAEIPIPEEPDADAAYPLAGSGDAPVTARLFGNLKCPYTERFLFEGLGAFVDEYVRPGAVDLEVHAVPYRDGEPFYGEDGPRMARAGLAVWDRHPERFWSFLEYVAVNVGGSDWATPDRIETVALEAGVDDPEPIGAATEDDAYEDRLEQTAEYVREMPVSRVPRISVEGESYSPIVHREELDEAIEAALEDATD